MSSRRCSDVRDVFSCCALKNRRVENVMEGADHLVASPLTPALLSLRVTASICGSLNFNRFYFVWGCKTVWLKADRRRIKISFLQGHWFEFKCVQKFKKMWKCRYESEPLPLRKTLTTKLQVELLTVQVSSQSECVTKKNYLIHCLW